MSNRLGRTLHDTAAALESGKGSEKRMLRVLKLLRRIVPYERCALLKANRGSEPHLLVVPPAPPEVRAMLSETLIHLYGRFVDDHVHPPEARPGGGGGRTSQSRSSRTTRRSASSSSAPLPMGALADTRSSTCGSSPSSVRNSQPTS